MGLSKEDEQVMIWNTILVVYIRHCRPFASKTEGNNQTGVCFSPEGTRSLGGLGAYKRGD
jgi:hypothetical protein